MMISWGFASFFQKCRKMRERTVYGPRWPLLTVDGARQCKAICPRLANVYFPGVGVSNEAKYVLRGLGVTVDRVDPRV
jgi:hypothetical protein